MAPFGRLTLCTLFDTGGGGGGHQHCTKTFTYRSEFCYDEGDATPGVPNTRAPCPLPQSSPEKGGGGGGGTK